jgi:outer membrane usher protein
MKIKKSFEIISLMMGLILISTESDAATQAETTQVVINSDHTRVVIESSTAIRFSLFSLRNPERAILDIEGIDSQANLDALVKKIGLHHRYILPLKITKLKNQQFRIEFPFKVDADPRISVLKPNENFGYRLVMDIYPDLPAISNSAAVKAQPPKDEAVIEQKIDSQHSVQTKVITPTNIAATHTAQSSGDLEEMWLAVKINSEDSVSNALFLKRKDGRFLVAKTDLMNMRLRLPEVSPTKHDSNDYFSLDAIRGLSYELDSSTQTLLIEAPPSLYDATTVQGTARGFVKPNISSLGAFFNYDLTVGKSQEQFNSNALLELGVYGPEGVGVSSFLVKHQNEIGNNTGNSIIRLDSTFTRDMPEFLSSLRFGDIINKPGSWGRSLRLGGLQWGTNFSTQPTFISFPLPGISGEAVLPSTVDLFVNDSLRLSKQLPTGPFSIQDLPVITGKGEARLVTKDMLGRERVILQPYYVSPRLLQKGLHDYSYEVGYVRENYGLQSNDYGHLVAVATHRLGISDRFTGELHAEYKADQQAIGLSGILLMPSIGVFNSSIAASNSQNQQGGLLSLGFERQTRLMGFGIKTQITTNEFTQIGYQLNQPTPKQLSQIFGSWSAGKGSFGLSYTLQDYRDRARVELLNASYSTNFFGLGFLGVSASQFLSGDKDSIIGLTFTHAIAERTTASANITAQSGSEIGTLQIQKSLPVGAGFGYQLSKGFADSDRLTASIFAQNDIGTYSLEAAQSNGVNAFRASASGGAAIINGGAFMTRRISDSFALVDVPNFPNVRVYADNQVVAKTDSKGHALIPRLRPYQKNSIRIEQADIPMNAQIESVDLDVIPHFRSGVIAKFPVKQQQQGTIKVMSENDKPIPAGAIAYSLSDHQEFPVGRGGEVFITGLIRINAIKIVWDKYTCNINVPFTHTSDPLPFLGTFKCVGINL